VTTVFAKQGHYGNDWNLLVEYPSSDISISRIGDLLKCKRSAFFGA
jgi:hypothetical protein